MIIITEGAKFRHTANMNYGHVRQKNEKRSINFLQNKNNANIIAEEYHIHGKEISSAREMSQCYLCESYNKLL